ncbi:MAG: sugar phosphate isomerase/epimerase family protein [Armatimonadota bacterium]
MHLLAPEQRAGLMALPPGRRLSHLVRCAREYGCEGLHIGPELPAVATTSVLGDLKPSVHAGGVFNAASAEPAEIQLVIQAALDFANRIGATDVSVHPPRETEPASEEARARGRKVLTQALRRSLPRAQRLGLRLALETYSGPPFVFADLDEILAYCNGLPELGLLLDASHLHHQGEDPAAAARRTGDRLWGVHLSDALPGGDHLTHTNLPLTHGTLDLEAFVGALRQAGYDSFVALEVKGTAQELDRSLERLRSLLEQSP